MKRIIITALSTAMLFGIAAPIASAGISEELKAGDRVEIKLLNRGYSSFNPVALCDQQSRSKFYCSFLGSKGDCFLNGKAYVRNPGWRVQILSLTRDCY